MIDMPRFLSPLQGGIKGGWVSLGRLENPSPPNLPLKGRDKEVTLLKGWFERVIIANTNLWVIVSSQGSHPLKGREK